MGDSPGIRRTVKETCRRPATSPAMSDRGTEPEVFERLEGSSTPLETETSAKYFETDDAPSDCHPRKSDGE